MHSKSRQRLGVGGGGHTGKSASRWEFQTVQRNKKSTLVSKEELHEGNVPGCLISDESFRPTTVPGIK